MVSSFNPKSLSHGHSVSFSGGFGVPSDDTPRTGFPGITAMVANVAGGVGGPRRYFVILPRDVPVAMCVCGCVLIYQDVSICFNHKLGWVWGLAMDLYRSIEMGN